MNSASIANYGGTCLAFSALNCTRVLAANDAIRSSWEHPTGILSVCNGLLNDNVGMSGQFGGNMYIRIRGVYLSWHAAKLA